VDEVSILEVQDAIENCIGELLQHGMTKKDIRQVLLTALDNMPEPETEEATDGGE
jgi:hypothetical protein